MMSRNPHMVFPSIQKLKRLKLWDLQFVVKNFKKQGWKLKLKRKEWQGAQRKMKKLSHMCGAFSCWVCGYRGWRLKVSSKIFLSENISCTSKIELPDYSTSHYDCYWLLCWLSLLIIVSIFMLIIVALVEHNALSRALSTVLNVWGEPIRILEEQKSYCRRTSRKRKKVYIQIDQRRRDNWKVLYDKCFSIHNL